MKGGKSKGDTSKKADAKLSVKRKAAEKPAKKPAPAKKAKAGKDPNKPKRPPRRSLGSNLRRKIPTISKSPLSAKLLEISGNLCRLRIKLRSKQRRPSGRPSTIRSWSLTIRNSLTAGGRNRRRMKTMRRNPTSLSPRCTTTRKMMRAAMRMRRMTMMSEETIGKMDDD